MKRLGSISIDAFALFYTDLHFSGFWIEASEGERKRVIASDKSGETFIALPEGFEFTPTWIAKVVTTVF